MRRLTAFLFALLVLSFAGAQVMAQEKPPTTLPAPEAQQPKNEVERVMDEAKARGQRVMTACLEDCGDREIPEGVEVGHAVELVKPQFPEIARRAHASGEVVVDVIIDLDGTVIAAHAASGHPLLMAAAVAAARASRFTPTTYLGEPVKVAGSIKYTFVSQ